MRSELQEYKQKASLKFTTEFGKSFTLIDSMYSENHRHYHTFEHIADLLYQLNILDLFNDNVLFLATIFHDIIYDPKKTDNEERSAELFKIWFPKGRNDSRITDEEIDEVETIILESKHNGKITTPKSQIFQDLDLRITQTTDLSELIDFENKIFLEYQFVDYSIYKEKRIEVLEKLQSNPNLIEYVKTRKPNIGLFTGSFNPFHKGHLNVLHQAERIFDKVIIGRGVNAQKSIQANEFPTCLDYHQTINYEGLTTDFIKSLSYPITLIRGIRNEDDFKSEMTMKRFMQDLYPDLNICFIAADNKYQHISSSAIRELSKYGAEKNYIL